MAGKVKTTGFARFMLIMIIVAPLAYIGASYYNGQDGIENIKRLFTRGEVAENNGGDTKDDTGSVSLFGGGLRKQVEALKAENEELKERLSEQEQEIQELKREVRLLRR